MKALTAMLAGAAGLVALTGAAGPAAAQYYPNGGYGYPNGGGIGGVLDSVINGNRYGYGNAYGGNERVAIDQCARAAEDRASGDYRWGGNRYGRARVVQITRVDRRNDGWKVWGLIDSGRGYGYGNRYGYNNYPADLRFDCRVDYRGYVRDVDIDRNSNGRGW
jgi:hypothetical protein